MTCFYCGDRWTWLLYGWSKLRFCMPPKNHLFLVWALNLTSFSCGWSKLTWFQCRGSNLIWFRCLDRNWLGFCVGVENDMGLVSGSKLTWFFVSGHRNWLDFSDRVEINLIFVLEIEFDLVLLLGSKSPVFCAGGRNWLCVSRNWLVFRHNIPCSPSWA